MRLKDAIALSKSAHSSAHRASRILEHHWDEYGPKLLDMLTCFEDENNHCKVDMHYVRQLLADTNEVKGV